MPPPYSFAAPVAYRISSTAPPPPPHYDNNSKRKRSAGLELLRSKPATKTTATSPLSPTFSLPPLLSPAQPNTSFASFPIPPEPPQEQYDQFATQRATLRHAKSIPHLLPLDLPPPPQEPRESKEKKRKYSSKWERGTLEAHLEGTGGKYGGELRIYNPDCTVFHHPLNTLVRHSPSIEDVTKVHHSVYGHLHTLSFRIPTVSSPEPADGLPSYALQRNASKSRPGLMSNLFTRRRRGVTISLADSFAKNGNSSALGEYPDEPSASVLSVGSTVMSDQSETETNADTVVLLVFEDAESLGEWYLLLKSFTMKETPRTLRRLHVRILDLQETATPTEFPLQTASYGTQLGFGSFDIRSSKSSDALLPGGKGLKAGWAAKEHICVEMPRRITGFLSGLSLLFSKTSPAFPSVARMSICILRSNKSHPIATVPLSLVPNYSPTRDERYPVVSLSNEAVVGELRMAVSYQELPILHRSTYVTELYTGGDLGARAIYVMSSRGYFEQTHDVLFKVSLVKNPTFPWLLEMVNIEAKSDGATLFRNNTPLTRSLESAMKVLCVDFLRLSIGPTISTILENDIEVRSDNLNVMDRLVKGCWADMYAQRGTFPNPLRKVFAHLYKTVKQNHEEQMLHYKSVSSFLFLRLIGPALMRPHLFDLARGLPRAGIQRTLTTLAKILHAMAFFSDRDISRDPELGKYGRFIKNTANSDMMFDYLASFSTTLDEFQAAPPPPSPAATFFYERYPLLSPTEGTYVVFPSNAGPVDLLGEGAVFLETLYQRRKDVAGKEVYDEGDVEERVRLMDAFHEKVHEAAFPHQKGSERRKKCF
ncbi:hypothetical protein L198_07070 [Cryptococcus wingfieldii CBS 7118]|uniref:Ras-GAP domain-containing protein n=1 Tax=Cryptococcus wingfieldii CBS 7118 TaxID=1295528 RepID=A0A1E3IFR4_9TREE|nr:hypothetical protein L198_07070 [Cryptococcus wingfieldii CBS 7118]ODN87443.1 hypothetical protein L198_07070 [Cryptococcus wingfieldii CBS 7118]